MMKGIKINVESKKVEEYEDGLPEPTPTPPPGEIKVDLNDLIKLINYAKKMKWI